MVSGKASCYLEDSVNYFVFGFFSKKIAFPHSQKFPFEA